MLAIALIPSVVLLGAGVGLNAYLLANALTQREAARLLSNGYDMAVPFMPAMSAERRASIALTADPSPQNRAALDQARRGMDRLLSEFRAISTQVAEAMPPTAGTAIGRFTSAMPQVVAIRQQIDAGHASRLQVYDAFNHIADAMIDAANAIGRDSTDRDVALRRSQASELMRMSDWLDRSNALAAAAFASGGMTTPETELYNSLTRAYRTGLPAIEPQLPVGQQRALDRLRSSREWTELGGVEDAIVRHGFESRQTPAALSVSVQRWQDDARTVATTLSTMGLGELGASAAALEKRSADDALTQSAGIAVASLLLAMIILAVAVRLGNNLVRRLRLLRADTLAADARLSGVVERIRCGERVDVSAEVPDLDYGLDEVGEVAAAFSKAQRTAVLATVQEAHLREGANMVFLNIARRSQSLVQRQLQVLEKAQRATEDPDQIALLFQLDHLSTRERRNAENLIILGRGQLARQWTDAVRLVDLIRAAVAETEQYNRVAFRRIPETMIAGRAVADIVHLLAELVDNAIDFSPRESRIEVSSNQIGHGVIVEVDDQGIGIPAEQREEYNAMFRDPPDFGVMALTEDSRIGFFVVARLAHRYGIRVSLLESPYGGVRAVVLIPKDLITPDDGGTAESPATPINWFGKVEFPGCTTASAKGAEVLAGTVAHPEPGRTAHQDPIRATARIPAAAWAVDEPPWHRRPAGSSDAAGAVPGEPQTGPADATRPRLPKRQRQANLMPQLKDSPAVAEPGDELMPRDDDGALQARRMMAALQRGTERGRTDTDAWTRPPVD